MIMAGGTGGHVFPGLAVADYLREAGWRVVCARGEDGHGSDLGPKRGYDMAWVSFSGPARQGAAGVLAPALRLLVAFWQRRARDLRASPGRVSAWAAISRSARMMAALLGKPLVVHEHNTIPGLANKVLAGVADRVLCAFPGALKGATLTGNPVRPEIAAIAAPSSATPSARSAPAFSSSGQPRRPRR